MIQWSLFIKNIWLLIAYINAYLLIFGYIIHLFGNIIHLFGNIIHVFGNIIHLFGYIFYCLLIKLFQITVKSY